MQAHRPHSAPLPAAAHQPTAAPTFLEMLIIWLLISSMKLLTMSWAALSSAWHLSSTADKGGVKNCHMQGPCAGIGLVYTCNHLTLAFLIHFLQYLLHPALQLGPVSIARIWGWLRRCSCWFPVPHCEVCLNQCTMRWAHWMCGRCGQVAVVRFSTDVQLYYYKLSNRALV